MCVVCALMSCHKHPNHSNTANYHGKHTYILNTDTAASIGSQRWCTLLVMNVYVARAQHSFYYFRAVVTHATFGLLAVVAFR